MRRYVASAWVALVLAASVHAAAADSAGGPPPPDCSLSVPLFGCLQPDSSPQCPPGVYAPVMGCLDPFCLPVVCFDNMMHFAHSPNVKVYVIP